MKVKVERVKIEIPLLVMRDGSGDIVWAAGRLSSETLADGEGETADWLSGEVEGPMENVRRFLITAEIDLLDIPAVERVEGKVEEVDHEQA